VSIPCRGSNGSSVVVALLMTKQREPLRLLDGLSSTHEARLLQTRKDRCMSYFSPTPAYFDLCYRTRLTAVSDADLREGRERSSVCAKDRQLHNSCSTLPGAFIALGLNRQQLEHWLEWMSMKLLALNGHLLAAFSTLRA